MKDNTVGILLALMIIVVYGGLMLWSYFDHTMFPMAVNTPQQAWDWFRFIFLPLISISIITWVVTYFKCIRNK